MKKLFGVLFILTFLLAGCGSSDESGSESGSKDTMGKIYFIPIVETGSYWGGIIDGAKEKTEELGYEFVLRTSAPTAPDKMNKHIGFIDEALYDKDTVAIVFSSIDPNIFDPKLGEAKKKGIPVVTFDGDTKTKENRDAYVGTDNYDAGVALGREGAKMLKEKGVTSGSIATVAVNNTQTTMVDRIKGSKKGFEEIFGSDAKNFKWLETIADEDQSAKSKAALESQMLGNDDMVAVFSYGSDGTSNGVMEALRSAKRQDILHFGFDYTPSWKAGLEHNTISGIIDQDARTIGVETINISDKLIKKESVDEFNPIPALWHDKDSLQKLLDERSK